jgi:iron(III) transport system permease protein
MGRALRTALRRHERSLGLGSAGLLLGVAVLLPLARLLAELAQSGAAAFAVLASARPWMLLLRSLVLAGAVTALAVAIGTPMGMILSRMQVPGRRVLWVLHALPMILPPFILALGWFYLFGHHGFLGSAATSRALFGWVGVLVTLALAFSPVVTSLVALGVLGVDASLEEAGRVVAGPWRVLTRILLPAAYPALSFGAIVVFALAFSELGVPMFLRVDVFPAAVFARLGGVDYAPGEAFALVLPLLPIALLLLGIERRLVADRSFAVLGLRGIGREPLALGRWRGSVSVACWSLALLSSAPLGALAVRAARGRGFAELGAWLGHAPWNSLRAATLAATAIVLLGCVVGHAAARRLPGSRWLDALCVLAFVTPASVLGVGLIAQWNRPATGFIYRGVTILVVGYLARYAVVGVRTMASVVAQSPVHLEEAAAVAGAGYWRRLTRIIVPVHARGLMFAWVLALVFCLRDLEMSVLYYPPGGEPLTTRIFTLEANGPEPVIAALAIVQIGMTVALLVAASLVIPRGRWS